MNWSTSVLTTVSSDTEPSIIVSFHNAKYIFNTSENTTRSFLQSGRSWRRARALFFTQARVEKTGGLPGLVMTFADATISDLRLIGPQGLSHLLASMRLFTFRDSMKVQPSEIPWSSPPTPSPVPCYSDENLQVYAIPVLPFPAPSSTYVDKIDTESSSSNPQPSDQECAAEEIGKRKREPSPYEAYKKINTGDKRPGKMWIPPPLYKEMGKSSFRPEDLKGELADEYRQLVIRQMFPGTNLNTSGKEPKSKKSSTKTGKPTAPRHKTPNPSRSYATNVDPDTEDSKRTRSPLAEGFRLQLPEPSFVLPISKTGSPPAVSYLLVGPKYRGKFNAEKATELGVPEGYIRAALARGETVTFDVDVGNQVVQRTVKAEEVVAEPESPGAILILDVPSEEHIPHLIASFRDNEFYRKFWSENPTELELQKREYNTRIAYHMLGDGVLENHRYKTFMNGFDPLTHHIIASREHCPDPITFTSAAYNQFRLSKLDDKMFHMPKYSLTPKKDIATISGLPENCQLMASHLTTCMRPWAPPAPDPEVVKRDKLHPILTGAESLAFSSLMQQSMKTAQSHVEQIIREKKVPSCPGADVGIISLGTGGSLPSKYRNVLSTLVMIPGYGNILLDVGEGTWGQMVRNFGLEDSEYNVWKALRDLKCIYVSHMHADHHIGLAHVLAKRRLLDPPPSEPLYVLSIRGIHLYLRELSAIQDLGLNDTSGNGVIPILSESVHFKATDRYVGHGVWWIGGDEPWLNFQTSLDNVRRMCDSLGLISVRTVDVYHRCRAYGIVLKHKDKWSMTFSGDTAPSENLRIAGKNSTVLIHEATMADEEADVAEQKAHSTIGQAIAEGKKMNAQNILLTHFSARYPKMPPYLSERHPTPDEFDAENAIVPAFDHLNLTIGNMWKMQFYLSCVSNNFIATYDTNEDDDVTPTTVVNVSRA